MDMEQESIKEKEDYVGSTKASAVLERSPVPVCGTQVQASGDVPDFVSTGLESPEAIVGGSTAAERSLTVEVIAPHVKSLMEASNIDENQAKVMVYYCIMTWAPDDKPVKRPILLLTGEAGTGKNDLMTLMYRWCFHKKESRGWPPPEWVKAEGKSETALRNSLADTATAFVEEADKIEPLGQCERWYKMRYDISSKALEYNRQGITSYRGVVKNINRAETHNHFGFTVLHAQNPFQSPEFSRRTIAIHIVKNERKRYRMVHRPVATEFMTIACELVDWDCELEKPFSNSAWDAWEPWLRIAEVLGDREFISYVHSQIEAKQEEDEMNKLFEPKFVVLSEIIPLYLARLEPDCKPRIAITEVAKLVSPRNPALKEKQIAGIARACGFNLYKPGGKTMIIIEGREKLELIAKNAGIDDLGDVEELDTA